MYIYILPINNYANYANMHNENNQMKIILQFNGRNDININILLL